VLLRVLDLDATLEVGAIFHADSRGGDVAGHGASFPDLDPVAGMDVARQITIDDQFPYVDFRVQFSGGSHGESLAPQFDCAFHFAVDLQIFVARNLALDFEVRTKA